MSRSFRRHSSDSGFLGAAAAGLVVVIVLGVAAAGALLLTHHGASKPGHHPAKGTKARETAAKGHQGAKPAQLTVDSVTPATGSTDVAFTAPVVVTFSGPLAAGAALPSLAPSVPGSWERAGLTSLEFKPVQQFVPFSTETVTVPAGTEGADGTSLQRAFVSRFTVEGASVLRLQELLAELGYLPLTFTPAGGSAPVPSSGVPTTAPKLDPPSHEVPGVTGTTVIAAPGPAATADIEPSVPGDISRVALSGSFSWRFDNIPPTLAGLWSAGQPNVITTGAVMSFEAAHGLGVDGDAGPAVWGALLQAAAGRQLDTAPYDYVYVSEQSPEYVTVWRDGVDVFRTLANTGIPQAPTAAGTWPVYVRYRTTTMRGTEPNGKPYSDPGIPWVSYFHGGDALHGYLRSQYGFPQSLGCVEMPYSSAHTVYPYTPLGTLVTIE